MRKPPASGLWVSAVDAVALLHNLYRGIEKFDHMDANYTMEDLIKALSFRVQIPVQVLESALFHANMLHEQNEFWHPERKSFDDFVKRVGGGRTFNKRYNWLEGDDD